MNSKFNDFLKYTNSQKEVSLIIAKDEKELEEFVEILIRLKDEKGNLIPPMAFLPAAERYDFMPNIDKWVVANTFLAFAQHKQKLKSKSLSLWSINVSGQSM